MKEDDKIALAKSILLDIYYDPVLNEEWRLVEKVVLDNETGCNRKIGFWEKEQHHRVLMYSKPTKDPARPENDIEINEALKNLESLDDYRIALMCVSGCDDIINGLDDHYKLQIERLLE